MALISILIPWSSSSLAPERDLSWAWNRRRIELLLPEAEVCLGAPDVVGDPARFSRSLALNRAAELARDESEVFLIMDADTTMRIGDLRDVVALAAEGYWVLPERYIRLSRRASRQWMKQAATSGPPTSWERDIEQEYPFANSGVVAIPSRAFWLAGGFDERFKGWGGEDDAMRAQLDTLWAPAERSGIAFHLWHPRPLAHTTGGPYNAESRVLADRYGAVSGDREALRALMAEGR